MVLTGISFKQAVLHFIFAFICSFLFGWYGIVFVFGFIVGSELMQMCYRSFKDGCKWDDLWIKPFLLLNYVNWKDTLIDLLVYMIGIIGGLLCR